MLKRYFRNRKIKKFLTIIPRTLVQDYGGKSEYTLGQVETVAKKVGYRDPALIDIAVAIYCCDEIAKKFGIDEACIKKYRGYPKQLNIPDYASAGSHVDMSGGHE